MAPIYVLTPLTSQDDVPFPSIPVPPDRDRFALARGFNLFTDVTLSEELRLGPASEAIGTRQTFRVIDLVNSVPLRVTAVLRSIGPNHYFYVDEVFNQFVQDADLKKASDLFENTIFPQAVDPFGGLPVSPNLPTPRVTILDTEIIGAEGYFSSTDLLPKAIYPFSNERLMFYTSGLTLADVSGREARLLAHELQHAVHYLLDPSEEGWVNEGLSTLAEQVVEQESTRPIYTFRNTDRQLTNWRGPGGSSYDMVYMFFRYFVERYEGSDPGSLAREIVAEKADGIEGIEAVLERASPGTSFTDVFADWVTANYLGTGHGDLGYRDLDLDILPTATIEGYGSHAETVNQFGADYIRIKPEDEGARIIFQSPPTNTLLPIQAHSGEAFWWGNRGDSIDTSLSHTFDLSDTDSANLEFWTWFDIEDAYDHAYVEVSTNGGISWEILRGRSSSVEDPLDYAYGPSYTGVSGGWPPGVWVHESVDLSPYAGGVVEVRFQYITDANTTSYGFALDDISIPEIGFYDDAESPGQWQPKGFYRTNNVIPQKFVVRALVFGPEVRVLDVPISDIGWGEIVAPGLGDSFDEVVLVVAGVSPVTTIPASYTITVEPLR